MKMTANEELKEATGYAQLARDKLINIGCTDAQMIAKEMALAKLQEFDEAMKHVREAFEG